MKRCVKIILTGKFPAGFMHNIVQEHARVVGLEGTCQSMQDDQVKVIICGLADEIDDFLDKLHNSVNHKEVSNVEVEPFLKDKDYRGVFRVIE